MVSLAFLSLQEFLLVVLLLFQMLVHMVEQLRCLYRYVLLLCFSAIPPVKNICASGTILFTALVTILTYSFHLRRLLSHRLVTVSQIFPARSVQEV